MRRNQTSLTAAGIALARAIESEKPEDERICYDPYARQFVPAWMFSIIGFFIRRGYTEWRGPGVNGFLVARDRYIDDLLLEELQNGLQQLVIIGAGYDSRAYRFDMSQRGVAVFEVDHPATQKSKQDRVRAVFGKLPVHVNFVPVDFNTQTLEQPLTEAGYHPGFKTLFIWQGVTMYLTAKSVDDTLRFVRLHSRPGSVIVFDYVYRDLLEGVRKKSEISNMRRYRFMSGEGLTFGIEKGTVEDFLKRQGFNQVRDINADGLRQIYFVGPNSQRKVTDGYGIAVGVV
jgi:methyltransferase (TIGR00027 family)